MIESLAFTYPALRKRSLIASLALFIALIALISSCAAPSANARPHRKLSPYVQLFGDSLSNHMKPYFLDYHPSTDYDAVNGRNVSTLSGLLNDRLAAGPSPRVYVMELGTNWNTNWSAEAWRKQFRKVPSTSRIVVPTFFRDPSAFGVDAANRMADYTSWIKTIAQESEFEGQVCIASWRYWLLSTDSLGNLNYEDHLVDGVHPDTYGAKKLAYLVDKAVDGDCLS